MAFKIRLEHNIILATAMADGLSVSNIAPLLNISIHTMKKYFAESLEGYTFKRKNVDRSKDADICARFLKGEILQSIGNSYGVTGEYIRQTLKHNNITGKDGGKRTHTVGNAIKKHEVKKDQTAQRLMHTYGCTNG